MSCNRWLPWLCVSVLLLADGASAQASPREVAALVARSPHVHRDRLCVKLVEGSGAELHAGGLRSRTGVDLGTVGELFRTARAEPLFTPPWATLDEWHRRANAALPPGRGPGHLGLWFRLTAPSAAAAAALADALLGNPLVAHVHHEPIASLASVPPVPGPTNDLPPTTPLYTALQLTHDPSPLGHGLWRAQAVLGARGRGVALHMVESAWHMPHEDLSQLVAANFYGGIAAGTASELTHGIAGVSVVIADRNGYGMTGAADELDTTFYAIGALGGAANALLLAGINSQPGDAVMMVLMFLLGQLGPDDWVPLEFLQSVFDSTLTLTGNGRVVVTSGANGGRNLDDPRLLRRFDRSFRDSGAIMVAATAGSAMGRAWFSNFGSRIDTNSWGDNVVACGYGTLFFPGNDMRQAYTANYQGTSPAVPTITGLVGGLQGAARQQLERTLSAAELRLLLQTHGPASPDAIGRRSDAVAMMQALGILDGLELSAPDVALGGSAAVHLLGPAGAAGFLFVSFTTGSLDLGLNRKIHLGLSTMQTVGFLPMPMGLATWTMQVPSDPTLSGVHLYFQAGQLAGSAPIHVTNSCHLTIL